MLKHAILGIVQGFTEFIPVSSSAHLVIAEKILGISGGGLSLSVILHLGTALALVIFFYRDILEAIFNKKMLSYIIVVTIITGIVGMGGKDFFESIFNSVRWAAAALIFTGFILILTAKFIQARRSSLNIKDALILGIAQGIAIIPGISRSGITISALLFRGIQRKLSFKFSFLASIPAVFGASILEAKDINFALHTDSKSMVIGFTASLVSGIFSLWLLKKIINKAKLHYFGYYCIAIAVIALLFIR